MDEDTIENVVLDEEDALDAEDAEDTDEVSDESEDEGQATQESEQHVYSKEKILEILRDNPDLISEEDTFSIPAVRSRIDRVISKRDKEIREEIERTAQEEKNRANLVQQARNYVQAIDSASKEQLLNWGNQDPELMGKYRQAKEILRDPDNKIAMETSNKIMNGILSDLKKDMPDEDFSSATNVIELINLAKEKKVEKEMSGVAKMLDEKIEALRKELRGESVRKEDKPEVSPTRGKRYAPDSFEAIEQGYVDGKVSRERYAEALAKRKT